MFVTVMFGRYSTGETEQSILYGAFRVTPPVSLMVTAFHDHTSTSLVSRPCKYQVQLYFFYRSTRWLCGRSSSSRFCLWWLHKVIVRGYLSIFSHVGYCCTISSRSITGISSLPWNVRLRCATFTIAIADVLCTFTESN